MAADASIFNALLGPNKSALDYENDRNANALARLKLQDAQRTSEQNALIQQQQAAERNALQRIASGWTADTTPDQRIAALRNSGLPGLMTQADALETSYLNRRKTEADVGKLNSEALGKNLEAMKFFANSVAANPTPQNANLALDSFEKLTGYKLDADRQAIAQMQSPDDIKRWALGHALSADKLLPQIQNLNLGGRQVTQAVDPITGRPTVTGSQVMTQSPDSVASNQLGYAKLAEDRRHNKATENDSTKNVVFDPERGVLVDKLTGGARPAMLNGQPLGAKDKPLTDSQAKAYAFGSRMSAANDIISQLEQQGTKTTTPGMGGNGIAGRVITAIAPAQQQQLEQAKRDWINANLRRESGAVIGQSEFDSADRQYFAQPGDKPEVIRQKAENRRRAEQGVLAEVPDNKRSNAAPAAAKPSVSNW